MKEVALKLDDDDHREFKAYCAGKGWSMQKVLEEYVKYLIGDSSG